MTYAPMISLFFAALLLTAPFARSDAPRERMAIDDAYKWDLGAMYENTEAWEADINEFERSLIRIEALQGTLGTSPEALLAAIETMLESSKLLGNIYVYAGLKSFEDMRNSDNSANFSRAQTLLTQYEQATAFMRPALLDIDEQTLGQMISEDKDLSRYQHYIDQELRMRAYTLSEVEEKLLAAAGEPLRRFNSIFAAFNNADIKFGDVTDDDGNIVELTKARYSAMRRSTNRAVRETAYKTLLKTYESQGNFLAATYDGHIRARVFEAKIRGFDSSLHAATYDDAIPIEVYHNLIEVTRENSAPLQRYMRLRANALALETLQPWDSFAPIAEETMKDIPWETAKQTVAAALAPLGTDYVDVYWRGFEEGWVDVYESVGKRGGAYSWGTYQSKPYLSMNYNGTLSSVSTLAHEYGHSVHSYLANQNQPYVYSGYRTFIAEVASMTNEALLFQKLLTEADSKAEKIFLLQTYLDEFRGGFYVQAMFADFEQRAHATVEAGEALTKDTLNNLYVDAYRAYHGDAIIADPLLGSSWSRIPHFFGNNVFYVYQYSTSFAAATALAKRILDEGEPARERFLTLLRSGGNDYPIELLKAAGVDMTTSQPIHDTITVFEGYLDELEAVLE